MSHHTARVAFVSGPARVALYLRAETLVQATRQAALLHQAVDSELGWHIVAVFSDLTLTPWGGRRPGRDGALTSARTRFDVLMVTSLDRLTRNTDELMELIRQLTAADVTLCVTLRPAGTAERPRDSRRRRVPGRRVPFTGRPARCRLGPAGRALAGR